MNTLDIIILICAIILFIFLSYVATSLIAAYFVFKNVFVRTDKNKWGRSCSTDDSDSISMFNKGLEFIKDYQDIKKDVQIENNGAKLFGEFYDNKSSKTIMIIPGRCESLLYSYYFAIPYFKAGYNVFVFDLRSHGLSDGKYNFIGCVEYLDTLAWIKYLNKEFGVNNIILHNICIGCANALKATLEDNDSLIKGLICDGMYVSFHESMKNHLIEKKKMMWPILECINFWMHHYTKYTMKSLQPIKMIDQIKVPLLMLHSKEDIYSTFDNANILFSKAKMTNKKLVPFEVGAHSMLRFNDSNKYDAAVVDFVESIEA